MGIPREKMGIPREKMGIPRELIRESAFLFEVQSLLAVIVKRYLWRGLLWCFRRGGGSRRELPGQPLNVVTKEQQTMALARAVGHKDLRMLQVYYNESAEDIAKLLE